MGNLRSRLPFWGTIILFLAAFAAFMPALLHLWKGGPLTSENIAEIIVSWVILWFTSVVTAFVYQRDIVNFVNEINGKFLDFLRIEIEFIEDRWLYDRLQEFLWLRRDTAKRHPVLRNFIDADMREFMEKVKGKVHQPIHIEFTRDQEYQRMVRLLEATRAAKKYIDAVTYDAQGYMDWFWTGEFAREYLAANAAAVKRGVKVRRVFVMHRDAIEGVEPKKTNALRKAVRNQKKASIEVKVIDIDKVPQSWREKGVKTSFLICDDIVTSESYVVSENGEGAEVEKKGYVKYNDDAKSREMLQLLFGDLGAVSDESARLFGARNKSAPD